ncbi:M81 family metallopeptidase, partial [Nocardia sp.]
MVDAVDLLVPYRAYPHVDTRARGVEALELALGMTAGRERPTVAWR